jgi:hypothetical protein
LEGKLCGYGDYIFFCCNFGGGCREENRRKRSAIVDSGKFVKDIKDVVIFQWKEKDRDGKVTEGEANNYLKIIGFDGFDENTFSLILVRTRKDSSPCGKSTVVVGMRIIPKIIVFDCLGHL